MTLTLEKQLLGFTVVFFPATGRTVIYKEKGEITLWQHIKTIQPGLVIFDPSATCWYVPFEVQHSTWTVWTADRHTDRFLVLSFWVKTWVSNDAVHLRGNKSRGTMMPEATVGWDSGSAGCDLWGHMSHSHVNTIMNEVVPQGPSLSLPLSHHSSFSPSPLFVSATVTSLSYSLPLYSSAFKKRRWK